MGDWIRPEIRDLIARGNVTRAEVTELRCNSWEWQALVPAMDDDAFLQHLRHALENCSYARSPVLTYDEAVFSVHTPELIKRFEVLRAKVGELREKVFDRDEVMGRREGEGAYGCCWKEIYPNRRCTRALGHDGKCSGP